MQRHADLYKELNYQLESRMREIRQSGSEGGGAVNPALPTSINSPAQRAGKNPQLPSSEGAGEATDFYFRTMLVTVDSAFSSLVETLPVLR